MNTLFCLMLCVTVDWTATPVRLSDVPEGLSAEATLADGTGTVVFRNRSGHAVPISFDPGTLKVVTSRLTDATRTDEPVSIAGVALRTWEPDETRPSAMRPPDPFRLADGATLTVVCDREGAKPVLTAVEGHAPSPLPPDRRYRLVWHDEFDGTSLDDSKWSYRTNYWGRDAHWFAKPEHGCVEVKDGVVKLKIGKLPNGQFVSPQLQTGENMWDLPATGVTNSFWQLPRRRPAKFEHRYGYWECRCKLQAKRDWWSAFWLQSANIGTTLDAADSGAEIDVLECFYPGHVAAHNVFAYGYGPDRKRYETGGGPLENPTDWHTFGVLWDETGYTFYVDGKEDGRVEDCVSKRPLFALISTECRHYRANRMTGGPAEGLEAAVRANDAFTVDYVRVWEVDRSRASAEAKPAKTGPWDADVADFPRRAGETGDSARILRAAEAAGRGGVLWFPKGEYEIDTMLVVSNQCSLWLHKSAHLKAVKEIPYVLKYFGGELENDGHVGGRADHNLFIRGGDIDGNGLASCAHVMGLRHFTLADTTYRNGRKVGLRLGDPTLPRSVEGGYEIAANNLYFICNLPGLAGNVGLSTNIGDSHFTDIVVVDHTVGIRDTKWSNRYTRCHIWGGIVRRCGTDESEYLPGSVAFDLCGTDAVLTDCYADTAMTGFRITGSARIFNCSYFNNWRFRMDDPTVFVHEGGPLVVTGGRFTKSSPHATLYRRGEKAGRLVWRDNQPFNFTQDEMKGLEDELKRSGGSERAAKSDAQLAG